MSTIQERRRFSRVATTIPLKPIDGEGWLIAHDISLGGMQVTTIDARWPGTLIPIQFRLPRSQRMIRATMRVVGLVEVPHGIGLSLEFLKLAPESVAVIRDYCSVAKAAA